MENDGYSVEEKGDILPYPQVPARRLVRRTEVQVWVRSRSRKYYEASEEVVFMLMRAAELGTKGRPDSLYKKHISTCSWDLRMFNNALTVSLV